jgi:hypothetical protein
MKWYDIVQKHRAIGSLNDPQWDRRHRGDWRNFVAEDIRQNWQALTSETRVAVYLMAQTALLREEASKDI